MLHFILVGFLGCVISGGYEGDAEGECLDGADNDRDGHFDCDDQDCVESSDCAVVACEPPECDGLYGCGDDVACACEAYFEAYEVCITAYGESMGIDMSGSLLEDEYCEETYGDMHDQASADYLQCLAAAYNRVDCSDGDSYASIDYSGCTIE